MPSKNTKKTAAVAAKTSKPKTAASLRDLPPKKDAKGGLRKQEQSDK